LSRSQTQHMPEHKRWLPPRDPRWIRGQFAEAGAARRQKGLPSADAGSEVLPRCGPTSPPLDEVPGYWWADDRALHEAQFDRNCSLEETSGRTGESTPDEPPAQFEIEPLLQPGQKATYPGPLGPDPDRIRVVLEALDRDTERRRLYRADGRPESSSETARAEDGQPLRPRFVVQQTALSDRARQLLARYRHEVGPGLRFEDVDPLQFSLWLHSIRPFLNGSSWRVYRNAALAAVQILPHENQGAAVTMLAEDGRRRAIRARRVDGRRLRKEGDEVLPSRATRIAYSDYEKLVSSLPTVPNAPAADWLRDWLIAGISSGLLPGEWPLAELEEKQAAEGELKIWLHIVNPAQRHEPNRLAYRTLDISGFQPETLEAIRRMATNSRKWAVDGSIQQRRSDCAQMLYQACDALFPRRQIKFSLFTFRHQFIANMRSLMGRAEVIAMVGDVDVDDDKEHYTKRRAAWTKSDIKDVAAPIKEHVRQVDRYIRMVEDRKTAMGPATKRRRKDDENI